MTGKRKATEIDDFQPLMQIDHDGEHLPVLLLDCNQVRLEIQNFIISGEMDVTNFQGAIGASGKSERGVLTKTLNNFMKQKDPHGNQSPVDYAAYVFFEKTRVRDGKPKSQDRENSEKNWAWRSISRVYGPNLGGGHVEKRTLDNMGKEVDLGSIAVDRVHCRRGL
ncbi:hypothetical protein BTUL_0029g00730 [Botrytis tulipae]|uniref:DUF7726 domain-containing protein n=1 Tax=Botrytis tulipae TaxID=87230 RepID=A0A4Z1EZX8_9HELO|nr:hypothetical protein BTUL_0029g00730 [Botrytis tulipae]